ncbi:MAG: hypothetical protein JXR77_17455 [Lentisphaeria bacterium]|nr:hypothetical protein [Lentisphaeria bacterium]
MATTQAGLCTGVAILVTAVGLIGADPAAEDGLVGHWAFDERGAAYAADGSPNGLDGDFHGAVQWAVGPFGTALHLDGGGSHVAVPGAEALLDGAEALTVQAWVLWEGVGRYPNIVTGGTWSPGGFLVFVADSTCSFRLGRPGHQAGRPGDRWQEVGVPLLSSLQTGRWVHLAAVFQRPDIATYVDGQPVGKATWDYPLGFAGDLLIGTWTGKQSHRGLIDDLRIYSRARTAAEIAADVAATSRGRDTAAYDLVPPDLGAVPRALILENDLARLEFGTNGQVLRLVDRGSGRDLLAAPGSVASVRSGTSLRHGRRCGVTEEGRLLVSCAGGAGLLLDVRAAGPWFEFRVASVEPTDAEQAVLLRLPPAPARDLGHMACLAADDSHGVCLRPLDLRTRAAFAASPVTMSLVAERAHGIVGARFALVAGPVEAMRPALQRLTLASGVPVSRLGGAFSRDAPEVRGSYLFATVSEANVDTWIATALRGGFTHLHYSGWWSSLGHYEPRPNLFPGGLDGMAATVARIHEAGLKAGMHTLTGCISTNDPWVTPKPDPRLAPDASYTLAANVLPEDTVLPVREAPGRHDVVWSYSGNGNVLRLGSELVHYQALSRDPPYAFLECTRGAFRSEPRAHAAGTTVDHLRQRYLAFYPDEGSTLVGEVADRIAGVYNRCGMDQIYMDGAEGMGTGHAIAVMRQAIYDRLDRPALVEASCHGEHNWWHHSRLGAWDHPKWAFRQFTDMHVETAARYRRGDLLEPQMGWWALIGPSAISRGQFPEEVEYYMAKCMALDSAMSIQGVDVSRRPPNARQDEYFTLIGRYERLRRAHYFTPETLAWLARPGRDARLVQQADGSWAFRPVHWHTRRTARPADDGSGWQVDNPHAPQTPFCRVECLDGVAAFADPRAVTVATPHLAAEASTRTAAGVSLQLETAQEPLPDGIRSCLVMKALNRSEQARGAWAVAATAFVPYRDLRPGEALGFWVRGDGGGEVLNVQLGNPREHTQAYAEHYVTIDFSGWRYIEMPLRERDAHRYHDFAWPYFSQHGIFRNRLQTQVVSEVNLYLNHLPPEQPVEVYLGEIRLLPLEPVSIANPRLTFNGEERTLPVTLHSGHYLEIEPDGQAVHRDARGEILRRLENPVALPALRPGANRVAFDCDPVPGFRARAEVTLATHGEPTGTPNPTASVDWTVLEREYEAPRILTRPSGPENTWRFACRDVPRTPRLQLAIEALEAGPPDSAYQTPDAVTLDDASDPERYEPGPDNPYARYAYDAENQGVPAKPGVTARMDTVPGRTGTALRYEAASTRADNAGWSARGRRFQPVLDISACDGIGFWLHGDGKGEIFKVQLRDLEGKWHDMVTRVDFLGWRYCEFRFDRPALDLSRIEYLILYFNAIPGGAGVSCAVDDVRALRETARLPSPLVRLNDVRIPLPLNLRRGQRLLVEDTAVRVLERDGSSGAALAVTGLPLRPRAGLNELAVSFGTDQAARFAVRVDVVKVYTD